MTQRYTVHVDVDVDKHMLPENVVNEVFTTLLNNLTTDGTS